MYGVFIGYTWDIHGVFMGYTYVSGMCRVCIGYVSGMCRKKRDASGAFDKNLPRMARMNTETQEMGKRQWRQCCAQNK